MSKNFELMRRAGKLLEIDVPSAAEPGAAPGSWVEPSVQSGFQSKLARATSSFRISRRTRKWKIGRSFTRDTATQMTREESLRLVQQIFIAHSQEPPHVVVFAGIDHGNGCSRVCACIAEILQENLRGSVCLVEGNLRSPSLPKMYGLRDHRGLTDALVTEGPIRSFTKKIEDSNFHLLSCGSLEMNSIGLLNSNRLRTRFRDLRNEFDFVIVDAPPLARYSDAIALGRIADGIVLVLEANATRREAATQASEQLRAAQIRILAAVLNKRTFPIPDVLYKRL